MTPCDYVRVRSKGPLSTQIQMEITLWNWVERPFEGQGLGFASAILVFISVWACAGVGRGGGGVCM